MSTPDLNQVSISTARGTTQSVHRILVLGFAVMFLSTSVKSIYQVYFSDLARHFGGGRAELAWTGSLFMLVLGAASPLAGALSDRLGPLRIVAAGALIAGLALIGAGLGDSRPSFLICYGVLAAFGLAAMTYVPMGVLVDRAFDRKKAGFAYAVVTNGTSIGFIVLSPLWLWLQSRLGWSEAFVATGLVIAGPVAILAGLAAARSPKAGLAHAPANDGRISAWVHIRSDPRFYALAIGFFGCGATMAFIDVHLVAFWQDSGAARGQMAFSLSLLGVLELASGLATGWLAMRYSKHMLLGFFYVMRSASMLLLLSSEPSVHTVVFAGLFGASYLGTVVLTSMYCLDRYGRGVKGQVFGLLFLVHQVGAFASVQLGAALFDAFGSYRLFVSLLSILTIAGALACWIALRNPSRQASAI